MATVTALPDEVDRVISATVLALYKGRGLTAGDVARAIGVSHGTMSNRLNHRTPWTAAEVRRVADFFGVRIGDLYSGLNGMFPGTPAPQAVVADRRSELPRLDSNQEPAGYRRPTLVEAA